MAACRVLDEPIRLTAQYGQMGIEDVWDDGTDELVTRYGIGAPGIEVVSLLPLSANASCRGEGAGGGASETFGFPIYDTHGNMVATLGRSGSSFTLGNEQSYDVWGSVRSGSSSEQQGYVANLGHRADPESFLTYMRARYYEPHTGRFVSEDAKVHGDNWFTYTNNNPANLVDSTGNEFELPLAAQLILSKWGVALNYCVPFRIFAGAFVALWIAWTGREFRSGRINIYKITMVHGASTRYLDSIGKTPLPATLGDKIRYFYAGMAAAYEISLIVLLDWKFL